VTNFCRPYKNFKGFYLGAASGKVDCHWKQQAALEGKYFYGQVRQISVIKNEISF
jgi:hypothetical protein